MSRASDQPAGAAERDAHRPGRRGHPRVRLGRATRGGRPRRDPASSGSGWPSSSPTSTCAASRRSCSAPVRPACPRRLDREMHALSLRAVAECDEAVDRLLAESVTQVFGVDPDEGVRRRVAAGVRRGLADDRNARDLDKVLLITSTAGVATVAGARRGRRAGRLPGRAGPHDPPVGRRRAGRRLLRRSGACAGAGRHQPGPLMGAAVDPGRRAGAAPRDLPPARGHPPGARRGAGRSGRSRDPARLTAATTHERY